MKRYLGAFLAFAILAFAAAPAAAQNHTCPTAPNGDNSNKCASTAFVETAVGPLSLPQSAHSFFAGPASGSPAAPVFRLIVGTDLPNPATGSLGGVKSLVCATHLWLNSIDTSGSLNCAQPDFSDLTGRATLAQLPQLGANSIYINPTGSTAATQGIAVPPCANDGAHGLVYINGTGLQCAALTTGGSVTSVTCGTGLSGGTFTTTGTCALALTSATTQKNPANPTATASTTFVMMGAGKDQAGSGANPCAITPVYSSRVKVEFYGSVANTTSGALTTAEITFGSGTAPSNGAAVTGTVVGNTIANNTSAANNANTLADGAIITGLTPGTAIWVDLALKVGAGTGSVASLSCNLMEF